VFDIVNEPSDKHRFSTVCRSGNHTGKRMYPWHEMIGIVSVWNPKKTDYWFSKYNRVLLHYSVSIAAAAATTANIHLSAEAAAYSLRSAAHMLFSRDTTVRTRTR
jgi:hypothetical protein